ncbi:MAG: hypothetical protein IH831_05685 [Planctomycetes bacterium]|nr:hypothetical protein [Planctomycetota bacterium]
MMKLPQTDSIEKMAEFWDSHDVTDFEEELEEVADPVFQSKTVVKVPLDAQQAELAQQLAAAKGITLPNLIQQWVRDRVENP